MLKRLPLLLVPLASLAVDCNPPVGDALSSEVRIDFAGDRDFIDSHSTQMCVTPNGTVYVIWVDDRDGNDDVWMNRKLPGTDRGEGWLSTPIRVNQLAESNVWEPALACTDQFVHVVWEDDRDGEVESHQIYYQRSADAGDTFLPEDRLLERDVDGRTNSFGPQIVAVDSAVYVTWYDDANGAYDVLFVQSTDSGNNWELSQRIDTDDPPGSAWSAHPRIATSPNGQNVYIVWQDFRNGVGQAAAGSDIYFRHSSDRGFSFSNIDQRLDGGEAGTAAAFAPRIAADDSAVYVVWHDNRGGEEANDIYMAYSGNGGIDWQPDTRANLTDNPGFHQSLYPQVCVVGDQAHIVWADDRTQNFYRVFYNRATAGQWDGGDYRLDAYKEIGERGLWRLDGGAGSVKVACDGDNVLVTWLDTAADFDDRGFNDIVYNFSTDGGATWIVDTNADAGIGRVNWDQAPYRFDSIQQGTAFKTDLNVHLDGDVARAAWSDGRAGSTDIYFQQLIAGEVPEVVVFEEQQP